MVRQTKQSKSGSRTRRQLQKASKLIPKLTVFLLDAGTLGAVSLLLLKKPQLPALRETLPNSANSLKKPIGMEADPGKAKVLIECVICRSYYDPCRSDGLIVRLIGIMRRMAQGQGFTYERFICLKLIVVPLLCLEKSMYPENLRIQDS